MLSDDILLNNLLKIRKKNTNKDMLSANRHLFFLKKQTDNDLFNLGIDVVSFFQLALEIDSEA